MAERDQVFAWMAAEARKSGQRAGSAGKAAKHFGVSLSTVKSWIRRHGDPRKEGAPSAERGAPSQRAAAPAPGAGAAALPLNLGEDDPAELVTQEQVDARRFYLLQGRDWQDPLIHDQATYIIEVEQDLARAWRREKGTSLVGQLKKLLSQTLLELRQAQAQELIREREGTRLAPPPPDADVLVILAYQIERTRWQLALAEANQSLVAAQKLAQKEHELLVQFRDLKAEREAKEQLSTDERLGRLVASIRKWPEPVRERFQALLAGGV